MSDTPTYRPELLRAERDRRDWSKTRLIYAMRQAAAEEHRTLPSDATLKRYIARWENERVYPADYVPYLVKAYDMPAHALGLAEAPAEQAAPSVDYPTTSEASIDAVTTLWRADLSAQIHRWVIDAGGG